MWRPREDKSGQLLSGSLCVSSVFITSAVLGYATHAREPSIRQVRKVEIVFSKLHMGVFGEQYKCRYVILPSCELQLITFIKAFVMNFIKPSETKC